MSIETPLYSRSFHQFDTNGRDNKCIASQSLAFAGNFLIAKQEATLILCGGDRLKDESEFEFTIPFTLDFLHASMRERICSIIDLNLIAHRICWRNVGEAVWQLVDRLRTAKDLMFAGSLLMLFDALSKHPGSYRVDSLEIFKQYRYEAPPTTIQAAVTFIEQNFHLPLSRKRVALKVGVTPSTLSRMFRSTLGITFQDCLNRVRIQFACEALTTGTNSITDISLDSGFSELSTFIRQFRRHNGMSPREFRNTSRRLSNSPLPESIDVHAR
jgi:AraC-like DNA-binding protein